MLLWNGRFSYKRPSPQALCTHGEFRALRSATRGAASGLRKPLKRLERNFYFTFGVRIRRFLDRLSPLCGERGLNSLRLHGNDFCNGFENQNNIPVIRCAGAVAVTVAPAGFRDRRACIFCKEPRQQYGVCNIACAVTVCISTPECIRREQIDQIAVCINTETGDRIDQIAAGAVVVVRKNQPDCVI